jgi:hypothetical protein
MAPLQLARNAVSPHSREQFSITALQVVFKSVVFKSVVFKSNPSERLSYDG